MGPREHLRTWNVEQKPALPPRQSIVDIPTAAYVKYTTPWEDGVPANGSMTNDSAIPDEDLFDYVMRLPDYGRLRKLRREAQKTPTHHALVSFFSNCFELKIRTLCRKNSSMSTCQIFSQLLKFCFSANVLTPASNSVSSVCISICIFMAIYRFQFLHFFIRCTAKSVTNSPLRHRLELAPISQPHLSQLHLAK